MKINFCIVVIFFLLSAAEGFSQTKKGHFAISGKTNMNLQFSNTAIFRDRNEDGKIKIDQYDFALGFGYFIADNLIIALSGDYSYAYSRTQVRDSGLRGEKNVTAALGIVPQLSYYFPLEGKLKPSLGIGVGYIWLRERDSKASGIDNIVYSYAGPSYNAAASLSYFITRSVAFDLGAQYAHNSLKNNIITNETQKQNIAAGTFGVSVFF